MAEPHDPGDADVDAAFADIVARWDDPPPRSSVNPPWQLRPGPSTPLPPPAPEPPPVPWRTDPTGSVADALMSDEPLFPQAGDDEEGFVPGPTAPLPPLTDRLFWGALGGLVAGPLLLLWFAVLRPGSDGLWTLGAIALTVGGFLCLVLRQPSRRDDDPENGARV